MPDCSTFVVCRRRFGWPHSPHASFDEPTTDDIAGEVGAAFEEQVCDPQTAGLRQRGFQDMMRRRSDNADILPQSGSGSCR